jgi:hypothetical protein
MKGELTESSDVPFDKLRASRYRPNQDFPYSCSFAACAAKNLRGGREKKASDIQ